VSHTLATNGLIGINSIVFSIPNFPYFLTIRGLRKRGVAKGFEKDLVFLNELNSILLHLIHTFIFLRYCLFRRQ